MTEPIVSETLDDTGPGSGAAPRGSPVLRLVREWAIVLVIALSSAFLIRVFVLAQYFIDGPSMRTTLAPNDRVLVNKLSYRLHDVNRGDVVVFDRITLNGSEVQHDDLIKRVIALGGETIAIRKCDVLVNGAVLVEPYVRTRSVDPAGNCRIANMDPVVVPRGSVFVMGDNRRESFDSREFGPIDVDLIRGRAFVVIWPMSAWGWL